MVKSLLVVLTDMVFISIENKMWMWMCKQWQLYFNMQIRTNKAVLALSNFEITLFQSLIILYVINLFLSFRLNRSHIFKSFLLFSKSLVVNKN